MTKDDRNWLMFEWSDSLKAWVITVDKDVRLTIKEIKEVVGILPFIVRVNPDSVN